jgi:hypothetical protein
VHRKTNRCCWFYEAEPTPKAQLAYLDGLQKLSEGQLRTFIEGMNLPEAYRPVPVPYTPPALSPQHPRQHLNNFKGGLQADAYAGFHHLYGDGAIYEVACWAHHAANGLIVQQYVACQYNT